MLKYNPDTQNIEDDGMGNQDLSMGLMGLPQDEHTDAIMQDLRGPASSPEPSPTQGASLNSTNDLDVLAALRSLKQAPRQVEGPYSGGNGVGLALADVARGLGAAMTGQDAASAVNAQIAQRQALRQRALDTEVAQQKNIGGIIDKLVQNKAKAEADKEKADKDLRDFNQKEKFHKENLEGANARSANSGANRGAMIDLRSGTQAAQASHDFDHDPILLNVRQQNAQAMKDVNTLKNSDVVPPQVLDELTTGMANLISNSKTATVSATQSQAIHNLDTEWAKRKSYFYSQPENALSPENRAFLLEMFDRLQKSNKAIGEAAAMKKAAGLRAAYKNNPTAIDTIETKLGEYISPKESTSPPPPSDSELEKMKQDLRAVGYK